jgi:hypothetical protein
VKKHPFGALIASILLIAMIVVSSAAIAFAAGTGDDPTPTQDVLSRRELATKARLERETIALESKAAGGRPGGGIAPLALDAPYGYLYTPSHKQQTNYWCGPATCQVIDHYFGSYVSQSAYADFMGTKRGGTDFSLLDDCLRNFTGKPYYYYGGLSESSFNVRVSDSISNHGMPLAADMKIVASVWPYYTHDHEGHIVPVEAYDWRYGTVRLNDVFNEADYYSDGGQTFGRTTYDRAVVWHGVYSHFRRAVVSAP